MHHTNTTHTTHPQHNTGWCIFNDLAVAARAAQRDTGITRILMLDLDVHQGDGSASIFTHDASITTASMHCRDQAFPSVQYPGSDFDVGLPAGTGDVEYKQALEGLLGRLEELHSGGGGGGGGYGTGVEAEGRRGHGVRNNGGMGDIIVTANKEGEEGEELEGHTEGTETAKIPPPQTTPSPPQKTPPPPGPFELVLYNAGVDVHADDTLGMLCLTDQGIQARDRCVMAWCARLGIPIAAAIGGGYSEDHGAIVQRHVYLHDAASEYEGVLEGAGWWARRQGGGRVREEVVGARGGGGCEGRGGLRE